MSSVSFAVFSAGLDVSSAGFDVSSGGFDVSSVDLFSSAMYATFNLSTETLTFFPLMLIVKYFSARSITTYGPSYGLCNGDRIASCLT